MSVQAVAAEQPRVRVRQPKAALAGAPIVSVAMLASGILTYAFHVLAARSLGPHAYGQIAVLWAAMFVAAVVLYRPLEQTASRAIADRLARGEEAGSVLRSVSWLALVILVGLAIAGVLGWRTISGRLFLGDTTMTALLLAGIALYGLAYLVRGVLGGARWFGGYSAALVADAVVRLVVAAPLAVFAAQGAAAAAMVAAAAGGILVPLWIGRSRLRGVLRGRAGPPFRAVSALAFAAPAGVIAGADQLLVNGAPLLVIIGGGRNASGSAGMVFAATMLVRVPAFVFQGLAAALLPNFAHLGARHDTRAVRVAAFQTAAFFLGAGVLIACFGATLGPPAVGLLYGSSYSAGALPLALLGGGVGCYLAASTLSQALLALNTGVRAALVWTTSAAFFVGLYAALPGAPLTRISVAFAAAALANLALLAFVAARRCGR
jgi:O-antigen/teichoic acid export membrane protein